MDCWFLEGKTRRTGEKHICEECGLEFIRRKDPPKNRPKSKHCSRKCSFSARQDRIDCACWHCGEAFRRSKSKITSQYLFCSRKCKDAAQSLAGGCNEIMPPHFGSGTTYKNSLTDELVKNGCIECKNKISWLLSIHHIDGCRANNEISNLEVVCGNHHIKRHLRFKNGEWIYDPKCLTPRNLLDKLGQ